MLRNEGGLFHQLTEIVKAAKEPITATQVWDDHPEIRKLAKNPNRVSDYLGALWRRGDLMRVPAPQINFSTARWAYTWKEPVIRPIHSEQAKEFIKKVGESIYKKGSVEIKDNGKEVVIETPVLTIRIEVK